MLLYKTPLVHYSITNKLDTLITERIPSDIINQNAWFYAGFNFNIIVLELNECIDGNLTHDYESSLKPLSRVML